MAAPPLERADLGAEMRRARPRRLCIIAAMVAAMIAPIALAACGSAEVGDRKPSTAQLQAKQGERAPAAEVASLLAGIPQRGTTLGDPQAPVTVEFFGDLQCPYCRRFALQLLPVLIERYVRSGKLKIEYRSLETATRDAETFELQQVAALAAGQQNKLWQFVDLFYREQGRENSGYVTERYLDELAEQLSGLNLITWTTARNDAALARAISGDARKASSAGLTSTPSFLIGRSRAAPYAPTIERLLSGGGSSGATPSARPPAPA